MAHLVDMLNRANLHLVFRHTLATAALEDELTHRQLGPIHFLKYAYLADLAFATRNEGRSFTDVPWRFYHFGPWDQTAWEQLPLALESTSAEILRIQSQYTEDFERYRLEPRRAESLRTSTGGALPFVVSNALANAIHEHGSDTASLLRHVYLTKPMLSAAPGELLDLRTVAPAPAVLEASAPTQAEHRLTRSQRKARAERIESVRAEIARRLSSPLRRVPPTPAPRYDAVFEEGTAHLDRLAGETPSAGSGDLQFDESIWLSDQRREPDIP